MLKHHLNVVNIVCKTADELAFVGRDGKWRLEKGEFRIACGGLSVMLNCTETKVWETPNI